MGTPSANLVDLLGGGAYMSVYPSVCLSVCPSVNVSVDQSIYLSTHQSLSIQAYLYVNSCMCRHTCKYMHVHTCLCMYVLSTNHRDARTGYVQLHQEIAWTLVSANEHRSTYELFCQGLWCCLP